MLAFCLGEKTKTEGQSADGIAGLRQTVLRVTGRFWLVAGTILCGRETEAGLELTAEIVGVGEAAGLRYLRDGESGLVV